MMTETQKPVVMQGEEVQLEGKNQIHIKMPVGASLPTDFEKVKHLLSNKPLHRPNRARPLESS